MREWKDRQENREKKWVPPPDDEGTLHTGCELGQLRNPELGQTFWQCARGHRVLFAKRHGVRHAYLQVHYLYQLEPGPDYELREVGCGKLGEGWYVAHEDVCQSREFHWCSVHVLGEDL